MSGSIEDSILNCYYMIIIPLLHLSFTKSNPESLLIVIYLVLLSFAITYSKSLIHHRLFLI